MNSVGVVSRDCVRAASVAAVIMVICDNAEAVVPRAQRGIDKKTSYVCSGADVRVRNIDAVQGVIIYFICRGMPVVISRGSHVHGDIHRAVRVCCNELAFIELYIINVNVTANVAVNISLI